MFSSGIFSYFFVQQDPAVLAFSPSEQEAAFSPEQQAALFVFFFVFFFFLSSTFLTMDVLFVEAAYTFAVKPPTNINNVIATKTFFILN
jgi:hypothetical protein